MNQAQELAKTHRDLPQGDLAFSLGNEAERHQLVVRWNDSQAEYP